MIVMHKTLTPFTIMNFMSGRMNTLYSKLTMAV